MQFVNGLKQFIVIFITDYSYFAGMIRKGLVLMLLFLWLDGAKTQAKEAKEDRSVGLLLLMLLCCNNLITLRCSCNSYSSVLTFNFLFYFSLGKQLQEGGLLLCVTISPTPCRLTQSQALIYFDDLFLCCKLVIVQTSFQLVSSDNTWMA